MNNTAQASEVQVSEAAKSAQVKIKTKYFELCKDENGQPFVDTMVKVPSRDISYLTTQQASFDTLNDVMNVCDAFKKSFPKFTKSTDMLMDVFLKRMRVLCDRLRDKYNELLKGEEYTLKDIEDAGMVIAIHYDTNNIILLKEDDK